MSEPGEGIKELTTKDLISNQEKTQVRREHWDYESFTNFLVRLTREGESPPSISEFPNSIDIKRFHSDLNKMRFLNMMLMREIFAVVGVKPEEKLIKIFMTTKRSETGGGSVSAFVVDRVIAKAKRAGFLEVGDIHSHPSYRRQIDLRLRIEIPLLFQISSEGFSIQDLWRVCSDPGLKMIGVATRDYNAFAFRTSETPIIKGKYHGFFERSWEKKAKEVLVQLQEGGNPKNWRDRFKGNDRFTWDFGNLEIAKEYNLAIYRGRPSQDLARANPPI